MASNALRGPVTAMDAGSRIGRRQFMTTAVAAGAATLLPSVRSSSAGQAAVSSPRIIDVHHHYASPNFLASLAARNVGNNVDRFKADTPEKHLAEMDKNGVATAMLSQYSGLWFGDVAQARRDARDLNEWAAAKMVAPYKNRFGLFAALPLPDVEGSLKEIEYAFDTLKADGISLITSYDGKWLGDPSFDPVFEELNRRNAVVFTHPLEPACCRNPLPGLGPQTLEYPTDTTRAIVNLLVSNAATRYPNVRFIFSHAGGTLVSIAQRILGNEVTAEAAGQAGREKFTALPRQAIPLRHGRIGEPRSAPVAEAARPRFADRVRDRHPIGQSFGHGRGCSDERFQCRRTAGRVPRESSQDPARTHPGAHRSVEPNHEGHDDHEDFEGFVPFVVHDGHGVLPGRAAYSSTQVAK